MSKRSRFILILAVLVVCFLFLWPSISWYALTPKEDQALALSSLEKIKDYSSQMALDNVASLKAAMKANPSAEIGEEYSYLLKEAKKNYKALGKDVPSPMTVRDVLVSFSTEADLVATIESHYRDGILDAKDKYTNSVKLGLDLSGGMSVIVKADLDAVVEAQGENLEDATVLRETAMAQAIETLTSRIDKFGLSNPVIRQQGEDRIYIELPGAADSNRINSIIMGKGILNIRHIDSDATNAFQEYYAANPGRVFASNGELLNPDVIPEDTEVLGYYIKDDYGLDEFKSYMVVKKEIVLDGKYIKSAAVASDNITGKPEVHLTLDSEGAEIFGDFTASHVGQSLAIVSDDKIKSYASIREAIPGGNVSISGFDLEEAQNLQKVLQTAWLSVPLSVESQQVVGASLGEKAINEGLKALIIGLLAVMVFMLLYYKGAGFNAIVAQILNLYMMFSILSAFNLTITLSSIAGMILTIGMAVDANVIIFERIKEEIRAGKGRAAAIAAGFGHAFWAIMDSNITTFIAAVFLSQLGTGSIQGFAVSLAIGVVSSVFTALIVSRLIFDFNTEVIKKQKVSISWRIK
jgi:preprotein translocase subunit SecD